MFAERFIYFSFLISLFFLLRRFDLSRILRALIAGISSIVFIYGILQKFVLFPIYLNNLKAGGDVYSQAVIARLESGRIFSIFRLPTLYAIICAILILFLFHYFLEARKHKIAWGLLLVMGLANLVLTQSFGGLIYLSAGIMLYLLLSGILKFKYLAPILMVLVLFFSITIAFRYSEAKKLEPVTLRLSNWAQAARAVSAAPFWGVGLGNYEAAASYFIRPGEARSVYAHNFFLQFAAETGLLLPLFLGLLLFQARKKLKPPAPRDRRTILYMSVFCILITYNLIDIGFYFFSAGVTAVVVLSQAYPSREGGTGGLKYSLVIAVLPAVLLGVGALSENYRNRGDLQLSQHYPADAEKNYKKSAAVNPFNFKTKMALANLEISRGNTGTAETYLEQALDSYPDASYTHYWLSRLALVDKHLWTAFFHASHAHRKNPVDLRYRAWYMEIKKYLDDHLNRAEAAQ